MSDRPIRMAARRRRVTARPLPHARSRPRRASHAGSSRASRAPPALGADTSRPPWRPAMSDAIARPRPRDPCPRPGPPGERRHRRREARPGVGDLDPDPAGAPRAPRARPSPPRARARSRAGCRPPAPAGRGRRGRARPARPRRPADPRRTPARRPATSSAWCGEQLADVHDVGAIGRPPARPGRGEVVQGEAGPPQLELERRQPRCRPGRPGAAHRAARGGPRSAARAARGTRARRARAPRRSSRHASAAIPRRRGRHEPGPGRRGGHDGIPSTSR